MLAENNDAPEVVSGNGKLTRLLKAYLPPYLRFCFRMMLLQLLFFMVIRVVFYLFAAPSDVGSVNFWDKWTAFQRGITFDLIVLAWSFALPLLLFYIGALFPRSAGFCTRAAISLLRVLLIIGILVCVADIPYYGQFGAHLSKQAFLWNTNAGTILQLLFESFSYWGFLLLFVVVLIPWLWLYRKARKQFLLVSKQLPAQKKWVIIASGPVGILLLLICAHGRITKTTAVQEGFAVVCDHGFINQLALNANYTFFKSVFTNRTGKYEEPREIAAYLAYTRRYLGGNSTDTMGISRFVNLAGNAEKPNVVVVIMESMALFKMGYYNGKNLTPRFNEIIRESVYFDHFFSSGIHTFNGIFSTSCGYPSVMDEHALLHYTRSDFYNLAAILEERDYDNYFFTPQDPLFDNMGGFLRMNHFKHVIGVDDYPAHEVLSSLGVGDHVMFEKLIQTINARPERQPFYALLMTCSDHGPWKIPTNIPYRPVGANEQEKSTGYADWSLWQLMQAAKKQAWYNNTIFVFLGDHGLSMGHTYEMPLSYHHVPLVIHYPKHLVPDTNANLGYQPDVNATILALLGRSYRDESFGIDLLHRSHPFVPFTADDKIGVIDQHGNYYYELLNNGIKRLRHYPGLDPKDYLRQQQKLADSLAYGGKAILESARYLIHKKHYNY